MIFPVSLLATLFFLISRISQIQCITKHSDGDHRKKVKFSNYDRDATFVPIVGTKISTYKTKMCPFIRSEGHWHKGHKCVYAHSKYQLRDGKLS